MANLPRMTERELKTFLETCHASGKQEMVSAIIKEMNLRGIANKRHFTLLKWHQDRVDRVMEDFKTIASAVKGNRRTSYTAAGGLKIGRPTGHPEKYWIDSYSAIKTLTTNSIFICYVKEPGDDPEFQLRIDGGIKQSFTADELPEALRKWRTLAEGLARESSACIE